VVCFDQVNDPVDGTALFEDISGDQVVVDCNEISDEVYGGGVFVD
jgi:hypothetical protein